MWPEDSKKVATTSKDEALFCLVLDGQVNNCRTSWWTKELVTGAGGILPAQNSQGGELLVRELWSPKTSREGGCAQLVHSDSLESPANPWWLRKAVWGCLSWKKNELFNSTGENVAFSRCGFASRGFSHCSAVAPVTRESRTTSCSLPAQNRCPALT